MAPRSVAFWLGLLLASPWCCSSAASGRWAKMEAMFKNLDAKLPPPETGDPDALPVRFGITVKSLKYNILDAHLSMEYWLRMAWPDSRLNFKGSDLFGSSFNVNASYIPVKVMNGDTPNLWIPDIACTNATDATVQLYGTPEEAYLYAEERITTERPYNVILSRPSSMNAYCKPALEMFPFDSQTCDLHFNSWGLGLEYLQLGLGGSLDQQTVEFPDSNEYTWDQSHPNTLEVLDQHYQIGGGWSTVIFHVHLKRRPMYYMLNAILPMFMMVMLSSFAFWMPINPAAPGSGERMGFAITCLLTIVAVGLFTAQSRPMLAVTTWLDRWISSCLFFTSIPIVVTIFVFFLDGIFRNMVEKVSYVRKTSPMHVHGEDRFLKYARITEDAQEYEALGSLRVMRVIAWLKKNLPCGFFNPRGFDKLFRHLFPIVTFSRMAWLLGEVLPGSGVHLWDSAVAFILVPFGFGSMALFVLGVAWLVFENCLNKRSDRKRVSTEEDDSDDEEEDEDELTYLESGP